MVRLDTNVHPSLCETVTENLRRKNIATIVDFITADSLKLATFTGFSHTAISEVKWHIFKKFGAVKRNALRLLETERNNIIPTNVKSLDELLRGGLYPGQICELCGPSSSGKTQLCMTIATTVATRSDIVVWYMDTKRDFSALRFEEMLRTRRFTQEVIEESFGRTKICHVRSFCQLLQALRDLEILCKTERDSVLVESRRRLVIVDSLPAIIFKITRYSRMDDYETTYELNDLADVCRFLANECRASVITVNSVTRWSSSNQTDTSNVTPALGRYWSTVPATRILLRRLYGEIRKITVWKDLRLAENLSCLVAVSDAGITTK